MNVPTEAAERKVIHDHTEEYYRSIDSKVQGGASVQSHGQFSFAALLSRCYGSYLEAGGGA